jgi:hypothetical protein
VSVLGQSSETGYAYLSAYFKYLNDLAEGDRLAQGLLFLEFVDVPATKNHRLHEELCMISLKRSWRILLLDVIAALAPILAALTLYLLVKLAE